MKIDRSTLIELLAARCSVTSSESERYLNALSKLIYTTLKAGGGTDGNTGAGGGSCAVSGCIPVAIGLSQGT